MIQICMKISVPMRMRTVESNSSILGPIIPGNEFLMSSIILIYGYENSGILRLSNIFYQIFKL